MLQISGSADHSHRCPVHWHLVAVFPFPTYHEPCDVAPATLVAERHLTLGKARFPRPTMEGRYATGDLERFPAPVFGVVPDLSFARDLAYETYSPAPGLAICSGPRKPMTRRF